MFLPAVIASMALCPANAQEQNSEKLRATSRLVQLDVLVHDSKGAPIRDLTKEDFVVLDEGRPCRLAFFQMVEERLRALTVTTDHLFAVNNRSSGVAGGSTAAIVILVDSLNMGSTEDFLYVKRELPKFLKHLQFWDAVALYSLAGPTVTVLHDFSDNTESLVRAAERGSGGVSRWLGSASGNGARSPDPHIRAEWTLAALEGIALHLANIPGRKTLVWVSSAFPITIGFTNTEELANGVAHPANGDLESYHERLKRLARILNKVDLSVYPVDPHGLAIDGQYSVNAPANSPARGLPNPRFQTQGENSLGQFATMDLIASETGGRAFYNANALGDSIQRAVDDSRVTYVLGFYPEEASWDGKYHRLEVRVNRPGVQVRSRRSYFASDGHPESEPERDAALHTAAASALNATAIGVTVRVASIPLKAGAQQIDISVDPQDVRFQNQDGKWRADFDLIVSEHAPDGRRLVGERSQCVVDRATVAEAQSRELSFHRVIDIQQQAATLRVLVRDSSSGAVGSLEVPIGHWRK